jgi:hypothetical protein
MSSANHAPILRWHYHYLQTERNKIQHDPRHLGVPLGESKMIFEPMVRSTQIMHLSCVMTSTISKWTELSIKPQRRVPSGAIETISEWYVWRNPCTYLAPTLTLSPKRERSEIPHEPHHLGVPSGASKMISKPMVCSTYTVHLCYVKISTMCERIEMSFHLSLIT